MAVAKKLKKAHVHPTDRWEAELAAFLASGKMTTGFERALDSDPDLQALVELRLQESYATLNDLDRVIEKAVASNGSSVPAAAGAKNGTNPKSVRYPSPSNAVSRELIDEFLAVAHRVALIPTDREAEIVRYARSGAHKRFPRSLRSRVQDLTQRILGRPVAAESVAKHSGS